MPTAQTLSEAAMEFARAGMATDDAVTGLLEICGDKRVAVVLARQQFSGDMEARPNDPVLVRAAELLDRVLELLPLG
jgi:hypothetical protein